MSLPDILSMSSPIWSKKLSQQVDRISSEKYHVDPYALMESAGRGVTEAVQEIVTEGQPVIVLFGPGNNGGDALVVARYLLDLEFNILVFKTFNDDQKLSPMCEKQMKSCQSLGIEIQNYREGVFDQFGSQNPLVVDGIFGVGFSGVLDPTHMAHKCLSEVGLLNEKVIVAIDIPSGLDADLGKEQEVPLVADVTVTFGGFKFAHIMSPARQYCGEIVNLDIGFPMAAYIDAVNETPPSLWHLDSNDLMEQNPWSDLGEEINKYDRGHVLVLGGSSGKAGACVMSGMAALRTGAGWATVAMPEGVLGELKYEVPPELTFEDLYDGSGIHSVKLSNFLEERRVAAVVIGPGAMNSPISKESLNVLREFVAGNGFLVVDAGATRGFLDLSERQQWNSDRILLTPHPGEWNQLRSQAMPIPLSQEGLRDTTQVARNSGIPLVYKGATPLIFSADPKAPSFLSNEGSAALARAGSGDVLCGIIAAHGAIGFGAVHGGLRALGVLASAAESAAEEVGEHSVLATDVIRHLGK